LTHGRKQVFKVPAANAGSYRLRKFNEAQVGNREARVGPAQRTGPVSAFLTVGRRGQGFDRHFATHLSPPIHEFDHRKADDQQAQIETVRLPRLPDRYFSMQKTRI
jgi:hypothetical protein